MHPVVGMGFAAGIGVVATAAFFAIIKITFIVTAMAVLSSAALGSIIAFSAPRFALAVIPVTALFVAHHDLLGVSRWAIWHFFHERAGSGLGYLYQYIIISFMIIGVLGGLQRRENGGNPFILSGNPVTFNVDFWEPRVTPFIGWWFLSIMLSIVAVNFSRFYFLLITVLNEIKFVIEFLVYNIFKLDKIFDFDYFCYVNDYRGDCPELFDSWIGYFTIYPIGIFWIIGFVAFYFVFLIILKAFTKNRFKWIPVAWSLVGPSIPLFLLTTTYRLHLGYLVTYVAWGGYAAFVAKMLWLRYGRLGRKGVWHIARWRFAILFGLLLASDIDWMLKQRLEQNMFGLRDLTAGNAELVGRPRLAWGGLPRLAFGFSPADLVFESLAPLFASSGEPPRNTGAAAPSSPAGRQVVVPSAQATPRTASAPVPTQRRGNELPLPPPPRPPAPALPTSSPGGQPRVDVPVTPASPPRSSSSREAPFENLLGERKAPSFGSGSTGVNQR